MEVPRLGVQSELYLLAYAAITAMPDQSCVCDLHHSSQQCHIPNPLSKARDWTCVLMDVRFISTELQWELLNRIKKKPNSARDPWDNIRHTNIHITGVPEGEEKDIGVKYIWWNNDWKIPQTGEGNIHTNKINWEINSKIYHN